MLLSARSGKAVAANVNRPLEVSNGMQQETRLCCDLSGLGGVGLPSCWDAVVKAPSLLR